MIITLIFFVYILLGVLVYIIVMDVTDMWCDIEDNGVAAKILFWPLWLVVLLYFSISDWMHEIKEKNDSRKWRRKNKYDDGE